MRDDSLIEAELTESVIGAFYEVYNQLGYGFLEHVHAKGLERELQTRRHRVDRETNIWVDYKGDLLCTQRIDMLVDDKLIIEVKSSELLPPPAMDSVLPS
jgi:GxxExxY protein